eukprot:CAMPEP_0183732986 /NCGR_PEP_ID=MMETSP0737-20130205/39880_1 /TAXON_ID=385413 /ORGANISM="Thalassiosira miniscula, Strain CCMP1093" /LENGTH=259 /DNA_ID=CAMNT_0025966145 /DNA_START=30 /DNA_END=809 /DNA_ORIENTATION=-
MTKNVDNSGAYAVEIDNTMDDGTPSKESRSSAPSSLANTVFHRIVSSFDALDNGPSANSNVQDPNATAMEQEQMLFDNESSDAPSNNKLASLDHSAPEESPTDDSSADDDEANADADALDHLEAGNNKNRSKTSIQFMDESNNNTIHPPIPNNNHSKDDEQASRSRTSSMSRLHRHVSQYFQPSNSKQHTSRRKSLTEQRYAKTSTVLFQSARSLATTDLKKVYEEELDEHTKHNFKAYICCSLFGAGMFVLLYLMLKP